MQSSIYKQILASPRPQLAVLIDPDKQEPEQLLPLIEQAENCRADFLFAGGSLVAEDRFVKTIELLKKNSRLPVVIFPGSYVQVSKSADALLMLSLISGRNAEYLIGQQVAAAPHIHQCGIEAIPTGYMLIDGGVVSSTQYVTQTLPIPAHNTDLAVATALAGELLGMKLIYLEAGSGALNPVPADMIRAVKQHLHVPLLVGGGIKTTQQAEEACRAGANVIVIGNVLEKQPELLLELSLAVHESV